MREDSGQAAEDRLTAEDLRDAWPVMAPADRLEGFRLLAPADATELFLGLSARDQAEVLAAHAPGERRSLLRLLAPDDAADVLQEFPEDERDALLGLLDETTRLEVHALLAYAEDAAGGLMSPRFARVRPEMSVDEAIRYLRRQTRERAEVLYYVFVLDQRQVLLGVVSVRELFQAAPERTVREVMRTDIVSVPEDMDQEAVSRRFRECDLMALPVLDAEGRMKGIVTVDDIVDVVEEEATEDIQKAGGMQALEAPYLEASLGRMIRKRAGWLTLLFLGETITTTAMARFEDEIARAVVLALFVPLIISSGGNAGSQASTLVIRAMALGEVRLRDWWRVLYRELAGGAALGLILGAVGFARIGVWEWAFGTYGDHWALVGLTVSFTLVGVVLWGAVTGSMLPFLLRRVGLDPASASAPFVATLVDVTGLVLYFSAAMLFLRGSLL